MEVSCSIQLSTRAWSRASTRILIFGSVPEYLTTQTYAFLGDDKIPYSRYTSREFHEREIEHMWPRTWQWACREEHLPEVGDYVVYDVGPYSAIVMRTPGGEIKAYRNGR